MPSSESPTYILSHQAYIKIVLHAAKNQHKAVNGVLLGLESGGDVDILDTIPLLHHWPLLLASLDIGLDIVRNSTARTSTVTEFL